MRLPRFRFRIRTLLLLAAVVAHALVGHRIYRDGPEAHWLVLKLRYGNVQARRSAAVQAWQSDRQAMFLQLIDGFASGRANPQALEAQWRRRERGAKLLLPALMQASKDPDANCRANAVWALQQLAAVYAPESQKGLALRQILAAVRDGDDSVRAAAAGSLAGLAARDTGAVLSALRTALADPSVVVRLTAAKELGMLGVCVPATQPDAASILIPLLASQEETRVRVKTAWGLCYFGVDQRRHPPGSGPDVVPAIAAALRDPDVEVRRTAAVILGLTFTNGGRAISHWAQRKDSIIPALKVAIGDDDKGMREESALALFSLGQRDRVVIKLIEQAFGDPTRSHKPEFESALKEWQRERETIAPVDPADQADGES